MLTFTAVGISMYLTMLSASIQRPVKYAQYTMAETLTYRHEIITSPDSVRIISSLYDNPWPRNNDNNYMMSEMKIVPLSNVAIITSHNVLT